MATGIETVQKLWNRTPKRQQRGSKPYESRGIEPSSGNGDRNRTKTVESNPQAPTGDRNRTKAEESNPLAATGIETVQKRWNRTPKRQQRGSKPSQSRGIEPSSGNGDRNRKAEESNLLVATGIETAPKQWDRTPKRQQRGSKPYESRGIEPTSGNGVRNRTNAGESNLHATRDQNQRNRTQAPTGIETRTRLSRARTTPQNKVLPGLEPGSLDSKSRVITNYTTRPPTAKPGHSGARTHDRWLIRPSLYHLSYTTKTCKMVPLPGFEPGSPAPQAGVLTTIL